MAEVDRELRPLLPTPLVLVAEPDPALRARAAEAAQRGAPEAEVVAAAGERAAMATVARAPALVWVADDAGMDAAVVIAALRACALGTSIWLRQPRWTAFPERAIQLGVPHVDDGDRLVALFPRLADSALRMLPRTREGVRRAEAVRRLAECYPAEAIRASGFHVPPAAVPPSLTEHTAAAVADALRFAGGNVAAASRVLGITRKRLYALALRHGIAIDRLRAHEWPLAEQKPGKA
jgi:hypothetical protein